MDKILEIIKTQLKTGHLSHAYLVFGQLENDLLVELFSIKKPDLYLIEEPIKIIHIRELTAWISLKPHSSPKRLIILKAIENMTIEAANALLKVLEEPPSYAVIILQALKNERILPTISSRCEIIRQIPEQKSAKAFLLPDEIAKLSIKERFDYASYVIEKEESSLVIDFWERYFREMLLRGEDAREILRQLTRARGLLSTNTSVKLLLENLVLEF